MPAPAVTEQQQVIGVVCARGALGLVEAVVLQVGGEVLFDAPCDIGGFQSPPTVIRSLFLQMFLVHLTLNVLPVSADFSRHADGDFIRIQEGGDFGDKGGEFQPCADIVLVLSEELRQGLHGVASALDKPLIGCGFLHGCHVLALQVLGNRHFLGFLVRQLGYDCGNFVPARNDGRTVTAFPENNPVTVCSVNGAHGDGLQHALPFDALGKFVKGCFIETFAWVEAARLNVCQCYHRDVFLCC